VDRPALSLSEQRQLRRDRAELNELRSLGLDYLEHTSERRVSFASMAARLEARRQFGRGVPARLPRLPGTEQRER
jgi:hypothetical protein